MISGLPKDYNNLDLWAPRLVSVLEEAAELSALEREVKVLEERVSALERDMEAVRAQFSLWGVSL